MKSILLTTTALVAFAGAAAADGHVSVTWSGTATAGVAREGGSDAGAGDADAFVEGLVESYEGTQTPMTATSVAQGLLDVVNVFADSGTADVDVTSDDDDIEAAILEARANIEALVDDLAAANAANQFSDANLKAAAAQAGAHLAAIDQLVGTAEVPTGDFEEYAELNATVTGSVALDNGTVLSMSMSVDAGRGYDFADDDGFDTSGQQSGSVGFDNLTVDAGAFGTLVLNPNDLAHLVDDDDDGAADVMYTNDFGVASVAFVMDIDEDKDVDASRAAWAILDTELSAVADDLPDNATVLSLPFATPGVGDGSYSETPYSELPNSDARTANVVYFAPVAADVQWSAKVSAPVADIATVYAAYDEEGGYAFGASGTVAGVTLNAKAKSEALAVSEGDDTEFEVGASYTISGLTVGATYNTVDDGDQWGISGSYTMAGITVNASTDEGEDWEVTGSYALSDNASLEAGVNYTEDAFVGIAFNF